MERAFPESDWSLAAKRTGMHKLQMYVCVSMYACMYVRMYV